VKRCWVCKRRKPDDEFYADRSRFDDLSSRCKECCDERALPRARRRSRALTAERADLPPRICRCGRPTPSRRHRYCVACGAKQRRKHRGKKQAYPPGRTAAAGYGPDHQKQRKREAQRVAAGGVGCARCHRLIPAPGSGVPCPAIRSDGTVCGKRDCGWDLGHDDHDRSKYTGPEHACCNRATKGRRRARAHRSGRW
jgi:hypothetical protein